MEDVDIGNPSPAVYMHLEREPGGQPVVVFVSRYGDTFCLERWQVKARIRYLLSQGLDPSEEHKSLRALAMLEG